MPSKKKKYNSRFPPARIKKIMQTDDEIGKVAAAVPVLISKCLEMFLVSILQHTGEVTKAKHAKTMSTSHLKECINNVGMFDFLKDVVANVADMQNEDEAGTSNANADESKKTARKRTSAQPKTPKKRPKLGNATQNPSKDETGATSSEDEDSYGESSQDGSNGLLSSSLSSTGHSSPKHRAHNEKLKTQMTSDSLSFHIPLSNLMSSDAATDDGEKQKGNKETSQEVKKKLLKKLDSSAEAKQRLTEKVSNDEAIDMSIKPTAAQAPRAPVIVTNSAVVAQNKLTASVPNIKVSNTIPRPTESNGGHLSQQAQSPAIPSALNMAHLYRPTPVAVPLPLGGPKANTEQTMPEGGMLSFLYSPFAGEAHSPSVLTPRSGSEHLSDATTKDINLYKSGAITGFQYPYNPMSAQKDSNSLGARISQFPSPTQTPVLVPKAPQDNDDDDDYDA